MEVEQLIEAMPLRWRLAKRGHLDDGHEEFDVVITIDGPALWAELGRDPAERPPASLGNGIHHGSLRLSSPKYVQLSPLSIVAADGRRWALPDLSWAEQVHVAMRVRVSPDAWDYGEALVPVARIRFNANAVSGDGADSRTVVHSQAIAICAPGESPLEADQDELAVAMVDQLKGKPPRVIPSTPFDDEAPWTVRVVH